jgi:hypothetical protein
LKQVFETESQYAAVSHWLVVDQASPAAEQVCRLNAEHRFDPGEQILQLPFAASQRSPLQDKNGCHTLFWQISSAVLVQRYVPSDLQELATVPPPLVLPPLVLLETPPRFESPPTLLEVLPPTSPVLKSPNAA